MLKPSKIYVKLSNKIFLNQIINNSSNLQLKIPQKFQNNWLNFHKFIPFKITHITLHKYSLIHKVSITRLKLLYREKYEQNTRHWERWVFGKNVVLSVFEGFFPDSLYSLFCTHTKTAKYLKYIILNECEIPSISDINTFNCLQFEVSNSVFFCCLPNE